MMQTLLFVYGTLMAGEPSHALVAESAALGKALTEPAFELLDCGEYPAMIGGGATAITGELYSVSPETLDRLDEYEGHPSLFRRSLIALADGREVEAYLGTDTTERRRVIPGGDWRASRRV
jgi:gamma-glutamylaminecyclotransferase